jgi:rubrerythrin
MSFEETEDGMNEVWTCDTCGYTIMLQGVGGDVSDCPECLKKEYEGE